MNSLRRRVALDHAADGLAAADQALHVHGEVRRAHAHQRERAERRQRGDRLVDDGALGRRVDGVRGPAAGQLADRVDDVAGAPGRRVAVAPSSAASRRRLATGSTAMIVPTPGGRPPSPPTGPRRRRRTPRATRRAAGRSTLRTVPAPVCMPQPSGAATLEIDVLADDHDVGLVGQRVRREARLPEEATRTRGGRRGAWSSSRPGASRCALSVRKSWQYGRWPRRALAARAAAAVAEHDAVAGPHARHVRAHGARRRRRPRGRARSATIASGQTAFIVRSLWQTPTARSSTSTSSRRGSSSSTSAISNGAAALLGEGGLDPHRLMPMN